MSTILAIFRIPEMSVEQYDNVMKGLEEINLGKIKERPFHFMGLLKKGSVVIDVWESEETLNKFFGSLAPLLEKNGVTPQPPEILPLHNSIV